jgi:hypothetical protein
MPSDCNPFSTPRPTVVTCAAHGSGPFLVSTGHSGTILGAFYHERGIAQPSPLGGGWSPRAAATRYENIAR